MSKILVIEDDFNIRDNIEELLLISGYDVITADGGKIGVDKAINENPDLIICDIMMPDMNGYDVIKTIREADNSLMTPFLFLTAKTSTEDRDKGMTLGADDYIFKPYRNEQLLTAVESKLVKYSKLRNKFNSEVDTLRSKIALSLPHEFRTPLNGIFGFLQILKNEYYSLNDEERVIMIDYAFDSAKRLNFLITNFIYYANLLWEEGNSNKSSYIPFSNIKPIIEECAFSIAEKYNRYSDLEINALTSDVFIKQEDAFKLASELIDNAFKFSKQYSKVSIDTSINHKNEYVLKITNFGNGMSESQIHSIGIFNQFNRDINEQQGIGLGLAISKKICELYGGTFRIDSVLNDYLSVIVTFVVKN